MATYLIQNGVNKTSTTWVDQRSKHNGGGTASSPSIDWNQSSKLRIGFYILANGYGFTLSGWNSAYNASNYAKLYVKCYASWLTEDETSGKIIVTQYGSDDTTGLSQDIPTSEGTLSFNLSSLSSSAKSSMQVYMYLYRHVRTAMTLYGYIKDMWLTQNFTITYNANGGSGAPSAQTFEEGTRTLSTTTPTRSGYSFLGWSTSSTATSATYAAGGSISLTANVVLYAVWKAELSTVSAGNGTIGTAQTITITQQGSNFAYKHTLKWTVNGTTQTIASGLTGSSANITYSWTPPASIVPLYTDRKTYPCVITVETYSGSTLLGSKTVSINLTVPNSYAPTLSGSVSRTNGTYPSGFTGWVKSKTTPYFSYTATPKNNASIVSWKFTVNGSTVTYSDSSTSKTYTGLPITSGTLTVTVTDSRGLTATATTTVTVTAYTAPTVTNLVMSRAESGGTISSQGQYLKVTGTVTVTSLSNTNTKTWSVQYKLQSASSWTTAASGTLSAYSTSFSWTSSSAILSDANSYDTRLVITDFYGSYAFNSTVSTALSLMDFKANGLGVAFGKVHEAANKTVELASDWSATGWTIDDTLGTGSLYDFARDQSNAIGTYLLGCQTASDVPAVGTVGVCILFKPLLSGNYSVAFVFKNGLMFISEQLNASATAFTWKYVYSNSSIFGSMSWRANANCNDFTTTGIYLISTGATNGPVRNSTAESWFILVVIGTPGVGIVEQVVFRSLRFYSREYRDSAWSSWKKFTTTDAT